ncbi:MAG: CDP-alcohol phosphatidyltransferase family protein [Longimicrobiales bacterium]
MAESATDLASSAGLRPSLEVQLSRHAAVMVVASSASVVTGWSGWLVLSAVLSFAVLWSYRMPSRSPLPGGIGWADALTGARLVVLILASASVAGSAAEWMIWAFALNVVLDAADGYVARRLATATPFGAVLDREVDAFFVLVAYLHFQLDGWLGAWVLVAGILPYAYRLLASVAPAPVAAGHKERMAARLAGLNFLLLIAAMAMPTYSSPILVTSVAVVCVSFASSFRGLCRHVHPLS